jgi:hypothetical protein
VTFDPDQSLGVLSLAKRFHFKLRAGPVVALALLEQFILLRIEVLVVEIYEQIDTPFER